MPVTVRARAWRSVVMISLGVGHRLPDPPKAEIAEDRAGSRRHRADRRPVTGVSLPVPQGNGSEDAGRGAPEKTGGFRGGAQVLPNRTCYGHLRRHACSMAQPPFGYKADASLSAYWGTNSGIA